MKTKDVFEETGRLGNEIKRLHAELDRTNFHILKIMEKCPHEIVFKYDDNHPRKALIDGSYFCPACGENIRLTDEKQLEETPFKDARIIPLTNLSLLGTKEVFSSIRYEVYNNLDFYFDPNASIEDLSSRMESVLEDKQNVYKGTRISFKRKFEKEKKND